MARKLKQLSNKIHTYIHARFASIASVKQPISFSNDNIVLAPVLQIAFLQGEAVLRLQFFQHLGEKHINDPLSQFNAWQQLIEDKRFIQQVVEQSELLKFFNVKSVNDKQNETANQRYQQLCFSTFCILLWDIHQNNKTFANQLVNGLINHFLPTLYPEQAKSTDIAYLKLGIAKQLAKEWHARPEIKESFDTFDDKVVFSLIAKLPKHSVVKLIELEGKRLKPTRLNAYQQLSEGIREGSLKVPFPVALTPKKTDKMRALVSDDKYKKPS